MVPLTYLPPTFRCGVESQELKDTTPRLCVCVGAFWKSVTSPASLWEKYESFLSHLRGARASSRRHISLKLSADTSEEEEDAVDGGADAPATCTTYSSQSAFASSSATGQTLWTLMRAAKMVSTTLARVASCVIQFNMTLNFRTGSARTTWRCAVLATRHHLCLLNRRLSRRHPPCPHLERHANKCCPEAN